MAGVALLALVLLADAVARAGWGDALLLAPWILLPVWAVYVGLYASHVRVDAGGALVQNLLRRTDMPWSRVAEIELRLQLVFRLDDGRTVTALGGPSGARPRRGARPMSRDGESVPPAIRAAGEVQDAWLEGRTDAAPGARVVRSWDVPAAIALVVLVVWAVSAVAVTGGPA